MNLFDHFFRKYDNDHYKRYPKSKMTRNIIYVFLAVAFVIAVVRLFR